MYSTRPSGARQDCLHSKEPFHCSFAVVTERRDLSYGAKLLHAVLVSQHRTRARWTQAQLAAMIGAPSRQAVWRFTRELESLGLVVVRRVGLQQPNEYTVLGVEQEDLDGKRRPAAGHQEVRPQQRLARAYLPTLKKEAEEQIFHPFYGLSNVHYPGGG